MFKKIMVIAVIAMGILVLSNVASARCWQRVNRFGVVRTRCVSGRGYGCHCGWRCHRRARRWAWRNRPVYRNTVFFSW